MTTPMNTSARRMTAIALGLAAATVSAAACGVPASQAHTVTTANDAPLRCEIIREASRGGTRIEARVVTDHAVTGTYEMSLTSRSGGGRTSIRQGGEFEAAPGEPAILSQSRLPGSPSAHSVDLTVRADGQRLSCTDIEL